MLSINRQGKPGSRIFRLLDPLSGHVRSTALGLGLRIRWVRAAGTVVNGRCERDNLVFLGMIEGEEDKTDWQDGAAGDTEKVGAFFAELLDIAAAVDPLQFGGQSALSDQRGDRSRISEFSQP